MAWGSADSNKAELTPENVDEEQIYRDSVLKVLTAKRPPVLTIMSRLFEFLTGK